MNRRFVIAALAAVACVLAIYMSLDQLRVTSHVWDPLGGGQTERVLHFFRGFPDAALGAFAYVVEIVLAFAERGKRSRLIFDLWSAALALGGVGLVAMQILVVHAICFLCCCTATLSVAIFTLAVTRRDRGF